jgi:hypothetical protein
MIRRKFFKTIFGAITAIAAAPLIPTAVAPQVTNDLSLLVPLLRRTMPTLIASELIGIQPMTGPTGQVFALNIEPVGKAIRNRYR